LAEQSALLRRELIRILLANRAARAIAGLKMFNDEFTLE